MEEQHFIKCSLAECKKRFKEVDSMNFDALCHYADKCSTCGEWILKQNSTVQKTYQKVSLKWAESFNEMLIRKNK